MYWLTLWKLVTAPARCWSQARNSADFPCGFLSHHYCLPKCTWAGSWNLKQSQDLNSCLGLQYDMSVLTARPNTCPSPFLLFFLFLDFSFLFLLICLIPPVFWYHLKIMMLSWELLSAPKSKKPLCPLSYHFSSYFVIVGLWNFIYLLICIYFLTANGLFQ